MATRAGRQEFAWVDLYWLPLGAGGPPTVRWSGRLYEGDRGASPASRSTRPVSLGSGSAALEVQCGGDRFVIEMAPVWSIGQPDRGVACEGAVGLPWLGRSRLFRYEVRRWRNGIIPDIAEAVASPQRLSTDIVGRQTTVDSVFLTGL